MFSDLSPHRDLRGRASRAPYDDAGVLLPNRARGAPLLGSFAGGGEILLSESAGPARADPPANDPGLSNLLIAGRCHGLRRGQSVRNRREAVHDVRLGHGLRRESPFLRHNKQDVG